MRGNYISSVNGRWIQSAMACSLRQIHEEHPTWGLDDMLSGWIDRALVWIEEYYGT